MTFFSRNFLECLQYDVSSFLLLGGSRKYPYLYHGRHLGIPKGRGGYVDWNSEDMGGGSLDWNSEGMGGVHWTGIPKVWGDFQDSNFQSGVVKSLQEKLVKNDLSKDDDSLVNTRHIQLNQPFNGHGQYVYANMTAVSCSLASRSVTKAIVGFSSIVLLKYNTVDRSKGFSAPILKRISSRHL